MSSDQAKRASKGISLREQAYAVIARQAEQTIADLLELLDLYQEQELFGEDTDER